MIEKLLRLLCIVAPLSLFAGCGDSTPALPDASAADALPEIDAPPGKRISIEVKPVMGGATIPGGRLVVAFYQQNDDLTVDPEFVVGYDVAFGGQTQTLEIPLDKILLPAAIDDYRFCPRSCEDLADLDRWVRPSARRVDPDLVSPSAARWE